MDWLFLINNLYIPNKIIEILFIISQKQPLKFRVNRWVVFHTHVADQIPEKNKFELIEQIQETGKGRDIVHIYNHMWDPLLHLDYYLDGEEYKEMLAETDGHGRWFQWKL